METLGQRLRRIITRTSVAVRHVVFGELAVAAAAVNEFCYDMAIRANRAQAWLIRQRDALDGGTP